MLEFIMETVHLHKYWETKFKFEKQNKYFPKEKG